MSEQSFMKALFFGIIAEDTVFPFPTLPLSERERSDALIKELRRGLAPMLEAKRSDESQTLRPEVLDRCRQLGLFGLTIPKRYGGHALSSLAYVRVLQEVSSYDASLALMLVAHEAIGARGLMLFGTAEQCERYLPSLASGEKIAAFALTERSGGSDSGGIRTRAVHDPETGVWRISGSKPWVTNASLADLLIVIARTNPADEGNKPRLTAFLVEPGPGLRVGERLETLGVRGAHIGPVIFDGVEVEESAVLDEVGKGFKVAMSVMNEARMALAAAMTGQCRASVNDTLHFVRERRSFGRAIAEFPAIKDKVSLMLADCYAAESMVCLAAGMADRKMEDYSVESAICRVAASEALWRVVNHGVQVMASGAYLTNHPMERRLRDARGGFVVDATNEILRCFIALSGMRGPGRQLGEVEQAMVEPVKGFGLLRDFAVRKVKEALGRERVTRAHSLLNREMVLFEDVTDALHKAVIRALREHGQEIAEMQHTQLRVANIAIDLFALAACLARTSLAIERTGEAGARRAIDLTILFAARAAKRMRANLEMLDHNDDALRNAIASRAYTDGAYPFEIG